MAMRANSPGAVLFSATLHAAAVAAVVAGVFWAARGRERSQRDSFVLVPESGLDLPSPSPRDHGARSSAPVVHYTAPAVPRVPVPDVGPREEPVLCPAVRPVSPARLSRPAVVPRPVRPASAPAVPQIDGEALAAELLAKAEAAPASAHPGAAGGETLDGYFARLTAALRGAHEMPEGVDALLVARVSFLLDADGTLSAVRVVNSSGNPDYDRSALAAFARVRSIGKVPGGQSGTHEINFQMTE